MRPYWVRWPTEYGFIIIVFTVIYTSGDIDTRSVVRPEKWTYQGKLRKLLRPSFPHVRVHFVSLFHRTGFSIPTKPGTSSTLESNGTIQGKMFILLDLDTLPPTYDTFFESSFKRSEITVSPNFLTNSFSHFRPIHTRDTLSNKTYSVHSRPLRPP